MRVKAKLHTIMSHDVSATGRLGGLQIDKAKLYITSDIHFFHHNIIKYCDRPWDNVADMNEDIIRLWNEKIPHDGFVFILGDLSMGGKSKADKVASYLSRLNGRKFLIIGNHDNFVLDHEVCMRHLEILPSIAAIKVSDQNSNNGKSQMIVMSHYPLLSWDRMGHNSWMLHGHCHGMEHKTGLILDVGLDAKISNYRPLSYNEIKKYMSKRTFVKVDHHGKDTSYY